MEGHWGHEDGAKQGLGKCKCGFDLHYGKGKNVKMDVTMNRPSKEEVDMEIDLLTPSEHAKHINLHLKGKVRNFDIGLVTE